MRIGAVAALAGAMLSLTVMPMHSAAPIGAPGWVLQQSCDYHGAVLFKGSAAGTRIDSKELSIFVNPDSSAYVYNNTNKTYCQLAHQIWLDKYAVGTAAGAPVKGTTGVVAGRKVTQYWSGCFRKGSNVPRFKYEYWSCSDLGLPAHVTDEFSALCGLPRGTGMPLRIYRHYGEPGTPKYHRTIFLDTFSVKPAQLTAADLSRPNNYRKVADEMDVIMADEVDELNKLIDGSTNLTRRQRRP